MYKITISTDFKAVCPQFLGAAVFAEVENPATPAALWDEICDFIEELRKNFSTDTIKERSGIAATRAAYRAAGKDPSRYRPACEQLVRRVLQGKDLYSVDTLVDLGNLVSLSSGYSTGAIDADKIAGKHIELGIGREGEPYEGIGRGVLNIAHLPVYRDEIGAFASPTSDSTRTMLSADTRHLLLLINGYDGDKSNVDKAATLTADLLTRYANARNIVRTEFFIRE